MSRKDKSSLVKVDVRQNDIRELMLEGKTTNTIVDLMNKKYGVHRRTVERDISTIYASIKSELSTVSETITELHIARYENLYRFYMDKGTEEEPNVFFNPETAAKMLEKKERLLGIINKKGETIINFQQNNVNIEAKEKINKVLEKMDSIEDLLELSSLIDSNLIDDVKEE